MIFQQFNLVGRLDVLNNVLMGRLAYAPAWPLLEQRGFEPSVPP
jgi:phosphonate transport system ATP-binding protein